MGLQKRCLATNQGSRTRPLISLDGAKPSVRVSREVRAIVKLQAAKIKWHNPIR
ncbi:MAG: hypothetical protein QOH35_338 [Acidobacteriaceae bacterium]|jgi:hypothetical protein|nr:hypothetical protein [Acidobacteriaceae bacterium]